MLVGTTFRMSNDQRGELDSNQVTPRRDIRLDIRGAVINTAGMDVPRIPSKIERF